MGQGELIAMSINYLNKDERFINGMYHVESFINTDSTTNGKFPRWYVLYNPSNHIVKPVLDYLRYQYSIRASKEGLRQIARNLCHFFNFLRLYKLEGTEKLTNEILSNYIEYLSVIPKNMEDKLRNRYNNTVPEFGEIKYLPVHPYIKNVCQPRKILKEWYLDYWSNGLHNLDFWVDPNKQYFYEDEDEWRYRFKSISKCVNQTLEFLKYLSESEGWKHRFEMIETNVAKRSEHYNKKSKQFYYKWDVDGRIHEITGLKISSNHREKKRVFFESELQRFLKSDMLRKDSQRKLLFVLLLLSGSRISEILNMLVLNLRVTLPSRYIDKSDIKKNAIVHWEDLFNTYNHNGANKADIYINEHLEFGIKIVKRTAYESKSRKNKTETSRFPILRDYFQLPKLLGLECGSIFVQPMQIVETFFNDMIIHHKERNPADFLRMVVDRHKNELEKGYDINHSCYDYQVRDWIFRIRKLIDSSWFGSLLKDYLVDREILLKNIKMDQKRELGRIRFLGHFLFVNFKVNKGAGIAPNTIRERWFKEICKQSGIDRDAVPNNDIIKHSKKADLTIHSYRHTYISMRINNEANGDFSQISLAQLKKDVGHVPSSTVAETVYYFADIERKKQTYTKVFEELSKNIDRIIFKNKNDI